MPICACRLCARSRRVRSVLRRGDVAEMRALIRELCNALDNVEFELDFHCAILDGSWPSAREYAERILEKGPGKADANT